MAVKPPITAASAPAESIRLVKSDEQPENRDAPF
jgi:hypothetical protein